MELIRINATLNRDLIEQIDEYAERMQEDRSTAIRQLLSQAIIERKKKDILKAFQQKKMTIRQAAEALGVDYWSIQDLLEEEGIPITDLTDQEINEGKKWAHQTA